MKEGAFMFGQKLAFKHLFTAEDIAEPLASVTIGEFEKVEEYFEVRNFDFIGFKENEQVIGFLEKGKTADLINLEDSVAKFNVSDLITNNTNLMDCLRLLQKNKHLFVINKSQIESIITLSDIQKPAVRMLFFGVVTFFESKIANLIDEIYPNEQWKLLLKSERIDRALVTYQELVEKNQEINLINCTQLCDKTDIILKNNDVMNKVIHMSKTKARTFFHDTNKFRNDLAHAQSLTMWFEKKDVITLVDSLIRITEIIVERDRLIEAKKSLRI